MTNRLSLLSAKQHTVSLQTVVSAFFPYPFLRNTLPTLNSVARDDGCQLLDLGERDPAVFFAQWNDSTESQSSMSQKKVDRSIHRSIQLVLVGS